MGAPCAAPKSAVSESRIGAHQRPQDVETPWESHRPFGRCYQQQEHLPYLSHAECLSSQEPQRSPFAGTAPGWLVVGGSSQTLRDYGFSTPQLVFGVMLSLPTPSGSERGGHPLSTSGLNSMRTTPARLVDALRSLRCPPPSSALESNVDGVCCSWVQRKCPRKKPYKASNEKP